MRIVWINFNFVWLEFFCVLFCILGVVVVVLVLVLCINLLFGVLGVFGGGGDCNELKIEGECVFVMLVDVELKVDLFLRVFEVIFFFVSVNVDWF